MPDDFGQLYEQHLAPVWRYVRARVPDHAEAEDLTSEVFARAVRGWSQYDATKGTVGAWLAGIAHHVVVDWWRRRGRETAVENMEPFVPGGGDPADVSHEVRDELRRHVHLLTEREAEALALRFAAGLSAAEVGSVLGVSDAGARMLVHRAVTKLREVMSDE